MYHIPNDKRAVQSAELLAEALLKCLKHKEFDRISVSDLNKQCFVSRSTFYRLFDVTVDVLTYLCDEMFNEIVRKLNTEHFSDVRELMVSFNREIMSRDAIIDAVISSHRMDILYNTHVKYSDAFLPYFTSSHKELPANERDCILSILTSSLCAYIGLWAENGKKESPEELTEIVMKSFQRITQVTAPRSVLSGPSSA